MQLEAVTENLNILNASQMNSVLNSSKLIKTEEDIEVSKGKKE